MNRPWQIWLGFGACLAVLLAAVVYTSATMLQLERDQAQTAREAAFEEDVRLALWRMDSALAPLLARESSRPYFAWSSFYPAERAWTSMFCQLEPGDVLMPSPLMAETPPQVLLHFQVDPDGQISSPQAPTGNFRDLAESGYMTHAEVTTAHARLSELAPFFETRALVAALPAPATSDAVPVRLPGEPDLSLQQRRNQMEWNARNYNMTQQQVGNDSDFMANGYMNDAANPPGSVEEGPLQPMWLTGDRLVLARRVVVDDRDYVQGCWLDWPAIRESLLAQVRDILPDAALVAEPDAGADTHYERMLSGLPVRLEAGAVPQATVEGPTPVRLSLVVAWACVLLAAVAVAVMLAGTVSLSERRGAFVSAVTHEMRTPLTTFKLYTGMLAGGRVKTEEKRQRYVDTLCLEADRLSHLVENVLAWAKLERGRANAKQTPTPAEDLLDDAAGPLTERATRAGLDLAIDRTPSLEGCALTANPSAVEQILFNLVENACKYAVDTDDNRLSLTAEVTGSTLRIRVRDHGPGIAPRDRKNLFRAFRKSATDAANSAPGVGLGLALSRRLARAMGGDLRLDADVTDGACFELSLPVA